MDRERAAGVLSHARSAHYMIQDAHWRAQGERRPVRAPAAVEHIAGMAGVGHQSPAISLSMVIGKPDKRFRRLRGRIAPHPVHAADFRVKTPPDCAILP